MDYEMMRLAEFLDENWERFAAFCEMNNDDPEEIRAAVGEDVTC